MEKVRDDLPDFDEWLKNYTPPVINYVAAYDPETGKVQCVGPDYSINTDTYKHQLDIDEETALRITSGEVNIFKCYVDSTSGSLEIVEEKNLWTMDDVLHRIVEHRWSEFEKPDVYVTADTKNNTLKVELSEEYGGTKKIDGSFAKRKIFWSGDTEMNFMITAYNDPHLQYTSVNATLDEVIETGVTFENIKYPEKFSIYTRLLLKYYEMEIL